jgi:hypothetical protein
VTVLDAEEYPTSLFAMIMGIQVTEGESYTIIFGTESFPDVVGGQYAFSFVPSRRRYLTSDTLFNVPYLDSGHFGT